MRKKIIITLIVLACLVIIELLVTGYVITTSAYMTDDYVVSDDGSEITFKVGIGSSMGFVRGYKDKHEEDAHYLSFYSCWGGLNSMIGAKNEYTLKLSPEDKEIYIYRGKDKYDLALHKDSLSGEWVR